MEFWVCPLIKGSHTPTSWRARVVGKSSYRSSNETCLSPSFSVFFFHYKVSLPSLSCSLSIKSVFHHLLSSDRLRKTNLFCRLAYPTKGGFEFSTRNGSFWLVVSKNILSPETSKWDGRTNVLHFPFSALSLVQISLPQTKKKLERLYSGPINLKFKPLKNKFFSL